jgi:hypothetical protein
MSTGTVNTFKINGVLLGLQPSEHNWIKRSQYGMDGGGHPVYPAMGQYQLSWEYMSDADFYQLVSAYNSHGVTGTAVVDLPQWGAPTYQFYSYSGVVIDEPEHSGYFENYYAGVRLLITSIKI